MHTVNETDMLPDNDPQIVGLALKTSDLVYNSGRSKRSQDQYLMCEVN